MGFRLADKRWLQASAFKRTTLAQLSLLAPSGDDFGGVKA
jgi:hypothetical protein